VVLVLVAALALPRPRPEIEVAAALAAVAAAGSGVDGLTSLAVHLTLAGALVTTSALLHRDRRLLAWPGGLLLAAATWVRLAQLGVEAPEAYTLPTAAALVLVGLHRLTRDRTAATSTTLLPGLLLATVPSLAWALAEPLTLRAGLLGGGCLALVLLGSRMRWSAPLLVGGVVGVALVLREAAPYLAETPQWVLIGSAGALLTAVGVTWERRVVELRRAGTYVGRLR
jgi:acyl dehydratase